MMITPLSINLFYFFFLYYYDDEILYSFWQQYVWISQIFEKEKVRERERDGVTRSARVSECVESYVRSE